MSGDITIPPEAKMKIDMSKQYRTREGRHALILPLNTENSDD